MKYYDIPNSDLHVSAVGLGCMRIAEKSEAEVKNLITGSLDAGINFFDHADIYGGGKCEEIFGKVLAENPSLRDQMILQSKTCIKPGVSYESSEEYIVNSVNEILSRLHTDHLDVLLLHRPDALLDPEEVAKAFDNLKKAGKVRYFGVSNMNPGQIQLIEKYTKEPLLFNQLQFSPLHAYMIDRGIHVNMNDQWAYDRDGGVLDFCRLNDITIQCWSILGVDQYHPSYLDNPDYPKLNAVLQKLADKYSVSKNAIVVAWILRHPAGMQPIIGTTNPVHAAEMAKGADIHLTHDEWYEIYLAENKPLP